MHRVLIIEDDPDIINLVEIHLHDLDCETNVATDGKSGLDMALSSSYDLVILDLMLPVLDGIAVCQKLRAHENFQSKPTDIEKYIFLRSLLDRNELLYYAVLQKHLKDMMHVIYAPTVGPACRTYSHIFR